MFRFSKRRVLVLVFSLLFVLISFVLYCIVTYNTSPPPKSKEAIRVEEMKDEGIFPHYFEYREMSRHQKDSVLLVRDSILVAEGYYNPKDARKFRRELRMWGIRYAVNNPRQYWVTKFHAE